jgi:hypothetical protein
MRVIPVAQFVGWRQIAQPLIDGCSFLGQSAGPEPVDQDSHPVSARRRFIHPLDGNRHGLSFTSFALLL